MELRRRFVFRGNAVAFGGRIVRPEDVVFEVPGASALPVTGGRSTSRISRTRFKEFLSFESATTFAEGLFDDLRQARALTYRRVREDALRTATRVHAEVRGLKVGHDQRLTVDRLSAELRSQSPTAAGEPPITIGDLAIEGLSIDGYPISVELERSLFRRYDTHAKLLSAADQPDFVKRFGHHFFMMTDVPGAPAPGPGRLVPRRESIYATVVKRIAWRGRQNPRARIDHHSIVVKNFGRIFLGELIISSNSRRLTLMRLELGSDAGGSAGGPEVDINGGWWP
jgi:hypothetical protein